MDLSHLTVPDAPLAIIGLAKPQCILYDVKATLPADQVDARL